MLGHRDDIASVLEDADVLVLSSLSEGMPLVLLEAMAASTPIVATDVGGVRECCDDGGAGMLVPPADPVALADALGVVLSDPDLRPSLRFEQRLTSSTRRGLHGWTPTWG
ncbi:MAG: glycosyltransferase [Candidatus Microthrix sp.]|nr:glycosyltransferase [Candidatus Microthrix sp.]